MRITPEASDLAILAELGARMRRARLERNITQESLAEEAGISRPTLHGIEEGRPSQLISVIRVLRALGISDGLEHLVPEQAPSPIELLKLEGKQRQRARGRREGG